MATDKVYVALNPTAVEVSISEDIIFTKNDSETKNDCEDSEKVGFKRSVNSLQQSAKTEDEEVIGLFRKRNYKVLI